MAFLKNKEKKVADNFDKEQEEAAIVSKFKRIYQNDYNSKSAVNSKMEDCYNAYTGSLYKKNLPAHVSQELSNFIFSTIETIKPSMLAENPKVLVFPHTEDNFEKSIKVQRVLDYEWKREKVFKKTIQCIHNGLIYGNGIMMLPWVGEAQNGLGDVKAIPISPFNIFVDSLATDFDDAEHVIYATYKKVDEAVHFCPEKAEQIRRSASTIQDKYLNFTNDSNDSNDNVLYIEAYFRDYSTEMDEESQTTKLKYPKGRRLIIIGDVLVADGENPYDDGKFPFKQWKCYEIPGKFWAISEVEMLISPQKVLFDLQNDIIDSANLMSNPVWVVDKNSGVAKGSLSNKKGLVVRKNPGTEVRRDTPPSLPAYIQSAIEMFKKDIEMISGVYDVTRGERPAGITAAAAIQALNEQSQGRIKLKVQVLEDFLGDLFAIWLGRIQQFWNTRRTVRAVGIEQTMPQQNQGQMQQPNGLPPQNQGFSLGNGKSVSFTSVDRDEIDGDYDVEIEAGSTLPINKSARIQQLIQLAQTTAEDGLPMVDRKTILENADIPNVLEVMQRFAEIKSEQEQQQQAQLQQQQQAEQDQQQMQLQGQQDQQQVQLQAEQEKQAQQAQLDQQSAEADHQRELEKMQMDSQSKMALQNNQSQLQSKEEGNDSQSKSGDDSQNELEQLLEAISQMDTETYEKFVEMHPEIIQLLEQLIPNNQQNELGGGDVNNAK